MDLFLSIGPIALLIFLMTKKNPMPSFKALPIAAVVMYFVKLVYFESPADVTNATVLGGALTALTPILIIWGAILLFRTMDNSGGMDIMRSWLNGITENRVAQLMIIGWAFAFLIEGASGFGTPAALATPILVGLGFPPVRVAILALVMNSTPVSFGAVGTPTWFGFGTLDITKEQILRIGFESAVMHAFAALVIPIIALSFVVSFSEIKKNLIFIYITVIATIAPYFVIAMYDYEFPSLIGGAVGLVVSAFLAKKGIGLEKSDKVSTDEKISSGRLVKATFPLWGTIVVLIVTRIHQLGIKGLLTKSSVGVDFALGSLGTLTITPNLIVKLSGIYETGVAWKIQLLYVPALIPFFLISFITFFVMKMSREQMAASWNEAAAKIKNPAIALVAALIFVKLLMSGGAESNTNIIGGALADAVGAKWQFFASYLGALGAFFSGSNTVSNLTFGGIQYSMAQNLNLSIPTILAMQSVGGAMGNMICINNIVAVCSVLGLSQSEGFILKRTVLPMIIYGLIAGTVTLIFF
jgi:lactate permease